MESEPEKAQSRIPVELRPFSNLLIVPDGTAIGELIVMIREFCAKIESPVAVHGSDFLSDACIDAIADALVDLYFKKETL